VSGRRRREGQCTRLLLDGLLMYLVQGVVSEAHTEDGRGLTRFNPPPPSPLVIITSMCGGLVEIVDKHLHDL